MNDCYTFTSSVDRLDDVELVSISTCCRSLLGSVWWLTIHSYTSCLMGLSWPNKVSFIGIIIELCYCWGTVATWLVRWTTDPAVCVQALTWNIVLCSWAGHLTFTVPLSTQIYKGVPSKLILGVTKRWASIPFTGSRNIPTSGFMLLK